MKTLLIRVVAGWTVLIIGYYLAHNVLYERQVRLEKSEFLQHLNQNQLSLNRIWQGTQWGQLSSRSDTLARLMLHQGVVMVAFYRDGQLIESRGENTLDWDITLDFPLTDGGMLRIHFAQEALLTISSPPDSTGLLLFLLIGVGSVWTWWLIQPLVLLESLASRILGGEHPDESSFERDDKKPVAQKAIHYLLHEHRQNKVLQTELSNRLRQHSFVDEITGLGNRDYFDAELEVHLKTDTHGVHGSVVIFSFEPLMELYHESRSRFNQLIKDVGLFFHDFSDEQDLCWVARRSNVDFALLSLEHAPEKILRLSRQMIKDLDRSIFDATEFCHHFVNVGVACFSSGDDAYDILASADMALRNAQLEGDNTAQIFHSRSDAKRHVRGGVRWRSFLQQVLAKRQVSLCYQAIHQNNTKGRSRYEVLSRINDGGQLIEAAVFIPMANRCGLAVEFDRLIVEMVLSELSLNPKFAAIDLAVNLFSESLCSKDFIDWLLKRLEIHSGVAKRIIFEITEFAVNKRTDDLKPGMEKLAKAGCRWCVDRVGSPDAKVDFVYQLPVVDCKLSKTVINHVEEQVEKQVFIQSLVSSAELHGIRVFAEGIEQQSQWELLISLGVCGGQGYWLSRPVNELPEEISQ